MGQQLNVNSAELLGAADTYTDVAERTAQLRPQPLTAKAADFQPYSQRFTEHAATYTAQDHEAAQTYTAPDTSLFAPIRPAAVTIDRRYAVIV